MHCSIAVIDSVQTYTQTLTDDCTDSPPCNLIILRANVSASIHFCINSTSMLFMYNCMYCTVAPEHSLVP